MIRKAFSLRFGTLFLIACCLDIAPGTLSAGNAAITENYDNSAETTTATENSDNSAETTTATENSDNSAETATENCNNSAETATENCDNSAETATENSDNSTETMTETEAEDLVKNVFARFPTLLDKFITQNKMALRSRLKKNLNKATNDSVIEKIEPLVNALNDADANERREKIFELLEKIVTESYHLLVKDPELNEYDALCLFKKIVRAISPINYDMIDGILYITDSQKELNNKISQTDDDLIFADEKNRNTILTIFHKIIVEEKSKMSKQKTAKPETTTP
ncbi:MAG: hypothetical protein LBT70_03445 [Holosporaceae bacterium]|jgi:hypothetical protein|nr:hypothetical protein [Holosporaceae bacterium]